MASDSCSEENVLYALSGRVKEFESYFSAGPAHFFLTRTWYPLQIFLGYFNMPRHGWIQREGGGGQGSGPPTGKSQMAIGFLKVLASRGSFVRPSVTKK